MSHNVDLQPTGEPQSAPAAYEPVVLIAEAHKTSRSAYPAVLERAGYSVVLTTGDKAAAVARTIQPAVIILELLDPAVSGLGLLRELRTQADTRATPVVTLMQFDDAHTREQIVRAGATAILIEPVKPPMLLRQLRRLLARALVATHSTSAAGKPAAAPAR